MSKYVVRHGVMRQIGVFASSRGETFGRSVRVIARTQRGLEAGEVLCEATEHAVASLQKPTHGQILRKMTHQDELELRKMHDQERGELDVCQKHIERLKLEMKLVDIEHVFGGERVVVYYLAENRVDFRELVRSLASEFQTRIEMRQIGVRDQAKLLADYGDCGKQVCCNTHLSEMPPVSMKMAKLQRATLDPSKISGRCGRLKCCLRYEYDTYQELQRELPTVGSEVVTTRGRAKVLAREILAGQVLVQTEDTRRVLVDAADVLSVISRGDGTRPGSRKRGERGKGNDDRQRGSGQGERSGSGKPTEKEKAAPQAAKEKAAPQAAGEPAAAAGKQQSGETGQPGPDEAGESSPAGPESPGAGGKPSAAAGPDGAPGQTGPGGLPGQTDGAPGQTGPGSESGSGGGDGSADSGNN